VGLDRRGQHSAWHQSGAVLVDHGDHENRPGRASPPRPGHGPQRVRWLCCGFAGGARLRLPGRYLRAAATAVLPGCCLRAGGPVPVCDVRATREGMLRPKQTSYRARRPRPSRRSGTSFRS
jgi:hypothetical protein